MKRLVFLFMTFGFLYNIQTQVSDLTLKDYSLFPFGAAIGAGPLKTNPVYRELVRQQNSSITLEKALKMNNIHPAQADFFWTDADTIINFAQKYGKRIHGHTLVWHGGVPDWGNNFVGDTNAWKNRTGIQGCKEQHLYR